MRMPLLFEWDPEKAARNARMHGVTFDEATQAFGDALASTTEDPEHSDDEPRYLTIGISQRQRLLVVWHTDRDDRIRIIGARRATAEERRVYESGE